MISIAESALRLVVNGPESEIRSVAQELRFRPDSFWRADSYQVFKLTGGKRGWDGYQYPLKVMGPEGDLYRAEALRGHLDDIISAAQKIDIEVDTSKLLPRPFETMTEDDLPDDLTVAKFKLDEWQRRCVTSWLSRGMGINRVTVSGGKTFMFASAAAVIKSRFPKARFLYMTQSERLVRQVFSEVSKFLPDWNISQYGGGHKDNSGTDMVVATAAMINCNFESLRRVGWFKTFMGVLYDESHHAQSPSSTKILMSIPAYFRLGASDTTKEADEVKFNAIKGLLGPILNEVEAAPLMQINRIARPTIYLIDQPQWGGRFADKAHRASPGSPAWALIDSAWKKVTYVGNAVERDAKGNPILVKKKSRIPDTLIWTEEEVPVVIPNQHRLLIDDEETDMDSGLVLLDRTYDAAVIRFKERNQLIVEWVKYYAAKKDGPTLVVATRSLYVLILHALISTAVGDENVRILTGQDDSKSRDEVFEWFKDGPGRVLISPLVQEGVSIPELRYGVIADHVVDHERMNQIIGRFIRKKPTGDNAAQIAMFVDRQHPDLRRNSIKLVAHLEKIRGYTFCHPVIGPETLDKAIKYEALF